MSFNTVFNGGRPDRTLLKVPASVVFTGSTALTEAGRITLPCYKMGRNGEIRIFLAYQATNNANNKTMSFSLGGFTYFNVSVASFATITTLYRIRNNGSFNSQTGTPINVQSGVGTSGTTAQSSTLDMNSEKVLIVNYQLANAADSIQLLDANIEIIYGE